MKPSAKWLVGLYSLVGLITLVVQFPTRTSVCVGAAGCLLSYVKGIVWSAIWPIYWAIQWNWLKF